MEDDLTHGIVCNAVEDSVFRRGALLWVVYSNPGNGGDRMEFFGLSVHGRYVTKWSRTDTMKNYRAKFIPPHLDGRVYALTRDEASLLAAGFEDRTAERPSDVFGDGIA